MDKLKLVFPGKEHEKQAKEYIREHQKYGESDLHGGALLEKYESYDDWLIMLRNNSNPLTVSEGWVPASTFFAIRESDDKIVGIIDIRHELNDFLREYGGHIGIGVLPTERKKGYATDILMQGLGYCRTIGLDKVMTACYKENAASRNTIIKCGGVLEKEFIYVDSKTVQVFWIIL